MAPRFRIPACLLLAAALAVQTQSGGAVLGAEPGTATTRAAPRFWWQSPVLKYKADTGVHPSGTAPHHWNKDESDRYLFCSTGFRSSDPGVLYSIRSLIKASSAEQVAPIVSGTPKLLYGGAWKGGAVSDELDQILTGNVPGSEGHALLPCSASCTWTKGVTVFEITNAVLGVESMDGMDFSHDSKHLYSNIYSPFKLRDLVFRWNVGKSLTPDAVYTTSVAQVQNLSVYYIGGKDLVYYGEGMGGGKVCVYDPAARKETVLIKSGLPSGMPANEIINVKVSGVGVGAEMHLYVQCDDGALYVYGLAADGKSVGPRVRSFSKEQMKKFLGASWQHMRAFEVTNDGTHAFFGHHPIDHQPGNIQLYVVWTPARKGKMP